MLTNYDVAMWALVNRFEAPGFIDPSERFFLGGKQCLHTFLERGKAEGWLDDTTPVLIINLRDEKTDELTKTWACKCWKSMVNVCQVSVRGAGDKIGDYLAGVLDEVVTPEINAGLTRKAVVLSHCNSGVHRAASSALAFLLKRTTKDSLSYAGALNFVVGSRDVVFKGDRKGENPTNNFQNQIESFYRMDPALHVITENTRNLRSGIGDGRQRELAQPPVKDVDTNCVPFVVVEPPTRPPTAVKRVAPASTKKQKSKASAKANPLTPSRGRKRKIIAAPAAETANIARKTAKTAAITATVATPVIVAIPSASGTVLDCVRDCSFKCNQTALTHNNRRRWCLKLLKDTFSVNLLTIEAAVDHALQCDRDTVLDALYSNVSVAGAAVGHFALLMAAVSSAVTLEKRARFIQYATKIASSHTSVGLTSFAHFFNVNSSTTCDWLFPASQSQPVPCMDPLARMLR